jgi:succinate dehydrogenase hydrophobic anchor subunit
VIDDYVHTPGVKIILILLVLVGVIAVGGTSLFALIRIASL